MIHVKHDIDGAFFLSDRVVVVSPQAGTIQRVVSISPARPGYRHGEYATELGGDLPRVLLW